MSRIFKQTCAILHKNLLCNLRSKVDIIREFIFPIVVVLIIILKQREYFFLNILYPFYLPLTLVGLLRKLLLDISTEKFERYKETLKIMSLSSISYTAAWHITFYIVGLLIEGVMLAALIPSGLFSGNSVGKSIAAYTLFVFSSIHLTFTISTLFSNPRSAIKFGSIILGLLSMIYFAIVYGSTSSTSLGWYYFLSFIPQTALSLTVMSLQSSTPLYVNYDVNVGIGIQAINVVLYFLLYLYLDQVVQTEYGVRKSYCFCLQRDRNRNSNKTADAQIETLSDFSSAKYHEVFQNTEGVKNTISLLALTKKFGDFVAVDDLSFMLYSGQIFCLLGHNGAGKTTAISMIVGLLKASSGRIEIFNQDLYKNLDNIRKLTGLCSQKDLLYPLLTVEEHLVLIGRIKSVDPSKLQSEISQALETVGLKKDSKKLSRHLSGGNKRKLSLAMAIMGGSQLLFLDEPTSGMDPVSRRVIWGLLKKLRSEGRTIILTTHHLEEAEELADRIGIMNRGKLLTLGTSEFIKKNFGVGYHLSITSKASQISMKVTIESMREKLIAIVKEHMTKVQVNEQSNVETLSLLLPYSSHEGFAKLFERLEQIEGIEFSLEMNTLEDAFINIGLAETENGDGSLKKTQQFETIPTEKHENKYALDVESNYNRYSDFSKVQLPPSFLLEAKVSLSSQISAMALRKILLVVRDISAMLSVYIFHIIYMIVGIIVLKLTISSLSILDQALTVARIIMLGYIFLGVLFLGTHVIENEKNVRQNMRVMGMRPLGYWMGTLVTDGALYLTSVVIVIVMLYIVHLDPFMVSVDRVFVVLLAFGCAFISFAYLWSFLFKSFHAATHMFPMVLVVFSYVVPYILVYIFQNYAYPNDRSSALQAQEVIEAIAFVLCPVYNLQQGLALVPGGDLINYFLSDSYYVALGLWGQSLVFVVLIVMLERKNAKLIATAGLFPIDKPQDLVLEDKGVLEEAERVHSATNKDPVKLLDVTKSYASGQQALKGVSYGVEQGQIFALLGPNGAGKSTSFNILSGSIPVSGGDVFLKQEHITTKNSKIFEDVGICQQVDSLWEHLTLKEHLWIYGKMKGLDKKNLSEVIAFYLKNMGLAEYENFKTMRLSGGNKRKLCTVLALLGNPKIQFFDEPSTGVDPRSKRYLWNFLQNSGVDKNAAVSKVITTHSMKEAESLATKIGILVNGKFACMNTLGQLRAQFGTGFNVIMQKKGEMQRNDIEKLLQEKFNSARKISDRELAGNSVVCFQIKNEEFVFSKAFGLLEDMKNKGVIEEFSITSCSLEQIFVQIAEMQVQNNFD